MTEKTEEAPAPAARPEPVDQLVTTEHSITIGGRTLAYAVTTGTIVLREEAEKKGDQEGQHEGHKPRASVFFTAYTLKNAGEAARRPLTFSFNGGPGSSSVWLHLGVLGPRRVVMDEVGNLPQPPFALGHLEDGARRTILDRAPGVHELGLAEDLAAGLVAEFAEPYQGRPANRARKACAYGHGAGLRGRATAVRFCPQRQLRLCRAKDLVTSGV